MAGIVTLVSREPHASLERCLADAGFEVRAATTPADAAREGTLIWLIDSDVEDRVAVVEIRAWLGSRGARRVVLVSDRPARLRDAGADPRGRVTVLASPFFTWQLVDAVRGSGRP